MKTFKNFIVEADNFPLVTMGPTATNLTDPEVLGALNRTLAQATNHQFSNPFSALTAIRKVLTSYGLELPQVTHLPEPNGEKIFLIGQFGSHSGWDRDLEDLVNGFAATGRIVPPQNSENERRKDGKEYFIYFEYTMTEDGFYKALATVTTENALLTLLSTLDNIEQSAYDVEDDDAENTFNDQDNDDEDEDLEEELDDFVDSKSALLHHYGWKYRGGLYSSIYKHPKHPNHEIRIMNPNKSWEHINPDAEDNYENKSEVIKYGNNFHSLKKHLETFHK